MTTKDFFKQKIKHLLWAVLIVAAYTATTMAQTPSIFTYQGRLTEAGLPANGAYDLQFALYDSTGAQLGTSLTREDVQVVNGVFTVTLDFGTEDFNGAARLLEIGVRPGASADAFTTLAPRQPVTTTPYAVHSLNAGTADSATTAVTATNAADAAQLGGVASSQYVKTDDPRLGDHPPAPGSPNYIQNATTQQADASFNISGDGISAGRLSGYSVNAVTDYSINFRPVFSIPGSANTFVGENTGPATSGAGNSFFGRSAGLVNSTGNNNAFFGNRAGLNNSTSSGNAFFGADAGLAPSGNNNTLLGSFSRTGAADLNFATAIGSGAVVSTSNTVALGRNLDTVRVPGGLEVSGPFNANGSSVTNLNASNITTGVLDSARLGTVPISKGGTGLTSAGASGNFLRSDGTSWTSAPWSLADIPAGSANYIQNQTSVPQAGGFNVSGNGNVNGSLTAGLVSARQYKVGLDRVLYVDPLPADNTFIGIDAGINNTLGSFDSGRFNTVVGASANYRNTTGLGNSIFGRQAGYENTGSRNSMFGEYAGAQSTGSYNSFFGAQAGDNNNIGNLNTFIGFYSDASGSLLNATAIGANALVTQDNSLVLGSIYAINGATADTLVGIGTTAPTDRLTVKTATDSFGIVHTDGTITVGTFVGGAGDGGYVGTRSNHPLHLFANNGSASLTIDTTGRVRIPNLGSGGSIQLCRNAQNQVSICSSSLRYKTDLHPFTTGLDIIRRLRPISFRWRDGGALDVGFGAEDVAAIEPLLVTRNETGVVEGVKYDRISVALVNAVREQDAEIKRLQTQLTNLQKLVCVNNPTAQVCK